MNTTRTHQIHDKEKHHKKLMILRSFSKLGFPLYLNYAAGVSMTREKR
jgi:uncharacterized protein YggL (DUF469 family)